MVIFNHIISLHLWKAIIHTLLLALSYFVQFVCCLLCLTCVFSTEVLFANCPPIDLLAIQQDHHATVHAAHSVQCDRLTEQVPLTRHKPGQVEQWQEEQNEESGGYEQRTSQDRDRDQSLSRSFLVPTVCPGPGHFWSR